MFTFSNYYLATSIEDAYLELMKNKKNIILGGTSYLRMSNSHYNCAIDLSHCNLNYIKEEKEYFHIGAMCTLRDLEINLSLNKYFSSVISKSLEFILGVQFRNNATVGGSIFSKYGFSDLIPTLLILDTEVVLFKKGTMSLEKFLETPMNLKDILLEIKIKKDSKRAFYKTVRKSSTDYGILNLSLSLDENKKFKISIGNRPGKGILLHNLMNHLNSNLPLNEDILKDFINKISFDDNMRGSKEYRNLLAFNLLNNIFKEELNCY